MASKTAAQSAILAVAVVASMVIGGVITAAVVDDDETTAPAPAAASSSATALPVSDTPEASTSLPDLIERVLPSVVEINTLANAGGFQADGLGTGVVIDTDGHILTNNHVIDGASTVNVTFHDGATAEAEIIGVDPANDLAVIKVDVPSDQLQPATMGDSDTLRMGDSVFAIGNPFSLDFSVTSGIVSGLDRESNNGPSRPPIRGVIQIDAAVNPGNSGGPLFNMAGEVVGINTAVENPTGQRVFVGIGYAVPSNTAKRFIPDLVEGRAIEHAQLGIVGVAVDESLAAQLDLGTSAGVYIVSITAGSAAEQAGLVPAGPAAADGSLSTGGDVIIAIDGQPVSAVEELAASVGERSVGDSVTLTVVRDGDEIEVQATLGAWAG